MKTRKSAWIRWLVGRTGLEYASVCKKLFHSAQAVLAILAKATIRILLVFSVLIYVADATTRLAAQISPAWLYFSLDRIEILPGGRIAIVYRESRHEDLTVSVLTELIGLAGNQPCAHPGRGVIETETREAVVPISRLLPSCDWADVPDGQYALQITASYPAGGSFDKSITRQSVNRLIIEDGRITGSTVPSTVLDTSGE